MIANRLIQKKDVGYCVLKKKTTLASELRFIGTFELPEGPSWVFVLSQHHFQILAWVKYCVLKEAVNFKGANVRGGEDQEEKRARKLRHRPLGAGGVGDQELIKEKPMPAIKEADSAAEAMNDLYDFPMAEGGGHGSIGLQAGNTGYGAAGQGRPWEDGRGLEM